MVSLPTTGTADFNDSCRNQDMHSLNRDFSARMHSAILVLASSTTRAARLS
jgi:hypothetical protein